MIGGKAENPVVESPTNAKIIRNTLFNTAGSWFLLILNILLIPFVISKLGVELYGGAWIIGAIILSFIGLIDFGVGNACTKYIAEYYTDRNYRSINIVVSTGIAFSFFISSALAGISLIFGYNVLPLLGVPHSMLSEAFFILKIAMIILVLVNTTIPMSVVLIALQRMDISNVITVLTSILNFCITIAVLYLGWGARGLILGYLAVQIFSVLCMIWRAKIICPQLHPSFANIDKEVMIRIFRFGSNLQLSRIAQILVFQFDKIIALRLFGPSASAFYDISVKVSSLARSIPLVLASAVLPAASELDANEEKAKIVLLYERGSKYMIIFGLLVVGFIFSETELILFTWMGSTIDKHGIETIALLIRILLVGYFVNITTGTASSIAAGIGKTNLERKLSVVFFIVSPMFLLVIPQFFGFYGVPTATLLSLGIGSIYYMHLFCKSINRPLSNFLNLFVKPLSCLVIAVIIEQTLRRTFLDVDITSKITGGIILAALFTVYAISYAISLKYLGAFDEYDYSITKLLIFKIKSWN